ncbi:RagB/SusD family nutrient uptake outer membrane protein [Pedobacter sp. Hv1]|uniref:RagB/SusD family nutrient uptake outer membrane protein n=1 Tax=Pedobacter sp. Hv1 TaxID=1740090 RepID=UPI000B33E27C|nr:RagB/SusD family nutrient uptake outer membrane protein [Pedobacter sp. Hv1]
MKKILFMSTLLLMITISLVSCKDYLEAKPDKKLNTLSSLTSLQAILDDHVRLNIRANYAAEVASDNYYLTDNALVAIISEGDKKIYNWEKSDDMFEGVNDNWYYSYLAVYYGNSVIENIDKIDRNTSNYRDWDNIKGQAYFYKGSSMLHAAFVWTPVYDEQTASTSLGLPIRASTDFNVKSTRSTLAQTYAQLIDDLKKATALLPVGQVHTMRPSKTAAYAMLSRTYLAMNMYTEAGLYADSVLQLNDQLLDYNEINATSVNPFPSYKGEVLFNLTMVNPPIIDEANAYVVDELYQQYEANDLRKKIFFKNAGSGLYSFKGNYSGTPLLFAGPAVDEMYLNRAESFARNHKLTEALNDLNKLMIKRWDKTKPFPTYVSTNQATVLDWILTERRKELLMRGIRWSDLKRLNKLGYELTISRKYNLNKSALAPNDSRYAMPLPRSIIELTGMQQNP